MARISVEAIRREQILSCVIDLVARKGYEATTVRDIADAADVATGTINYYFAGKDDVMRSALVEASRRFQARVDAAIAGIGDPLELLRTHAALATPRTPEELANQAVWIEFWRAAQHDEVLRELHERLYDGWRRQLAATIPSPSSGDPAIDAEAWARRFVALADGLALHVVLHPGSVPADDMEAALNDYISTTLA